MIDSIWIVAIKEFLDARRFFISKSIQSRMHSSYVSFFNEVICQHQGLLIQYHTLGKQKYDTMCKSVEKKDTAKAQESYIELNKFLTEGFSKMGGLCLQQAKDYYINIRSISAAKPRFSIKTVGSTPGSLGDGNKVYTVIHSTTTIANWDKPSEFNSNSSLRNINETGEEYICNNIPKEAKNGYYYNPRLISEKTRLYEPTLINRFTNSHDLNWQKCWIPYTLGTTINPEDCYKSTLVVPVRLLKNRLSDEFWEYFKMTFSPPSLQQDIKRTIFGFFCVDAPILNFFNADFDIPISYFFADIVSLYWFTAAGYTTSEAYRRAVIMAKNPMGTESTDSRR